MLVCSDELIHLDCANHVEMVAVLPASISLSAGDRAVILKISRPRRHEFDGDCGFSRYALGDTIGVDCKTMIVVVFIHDSGDDSVALVNHNIFRLKTPLIFFGDDGYLDHLSRFNW